MGFWDWLNRPAGQGPDPSSSQMGDREQMTGLIGEGLAGVRGREAPELGGVQMGRDDLDWRRRAIDLANQYGAVASGEQMGAGEMGVGRAAEAARAALFAGQRAARGAGAAGAGRAAARGQVDVGAQAAGAGAQAAIEDQARARQALGALTGQMRGQDIQAAAQQAGLDQARNFMELKSKMDMMGMNDAQYNAMLMQLFGINKAEMDARIQQEGIAAQMPTNLQNIGGMLGGLGGFASGIKKIF